MTTLGQRIREHRRRAGLSQEALARRMDVSRQAVTKWESGQSAPSTENLFRLAELFGTTVDLLLPSEGADAPAAEAPPPLWSRIRWRPRVLAALAVTAGYLVFYLLGRILWCPLEDSSLLGWLLWERPSGAPQSNCPPNNVPRLDSKAQVRIPISQGWYPNGHSTSAKAPASQCPIYPVHATSKPNIRLQ